MHRLLPTGDRRGDRCVGTALFGCHVAGAAPTWCCGPTFEDDRERAADTYNEAGSISKAARDFLPQPQRFREPLMDANVNSNRTPIGRRCCHLCKQGPVPGEDRIFQVWPLATGPQADTRMLLWGQISHDRIHPEVSPPSLVYRVERGRNARLARARCAIQYHDRAGRCHWCDHCLFRWAVHGVRCVAVDTSGAGVGRRWPGLEARVAAPGFGKREGSTGARPTSR